MKLSSLSSIVILSLSSLGSTTVTGFSAPDTKRVLVTGAAGQTGQHIFRKLLSKPGYTPIGTVRSEESRQALLSGSATAITTNADTTDVVIPPESVVVCDITSNDSSTTTLLTDLLSTCDALMICTSAKPAPTGEVNAETQRPIFGFPLGQPELVDWIGQKRLIDAAAAADKQVHVVLCGSMGGTNPNNSLNNLGKITQSDGTTTGGDILKWKRKSEVYLQQQPQSSSGVLYTIVHPGGLLNEPGNERELCVGVDDKIIGTKNNSVPREDVANVMIAALEHESYIGRSFDLVSKPVGEGVRTKDYGRLLDCLEGRNCDYSLGETA